MLNFAIENAKKNQDISDFSFAFFQKNYEIIIIKKFLKIIYKLNRKNT